MMIYKAWVRPILIALCLVQPFFENTVEAQVSSKIRNVLIAVFNATEGTNWIRKDNWLGPVGSECSWFGVVCSSNGSRLLELNLMNNGLAGSIPPEIGELETIFKLRLNGNRLSGSIPPQIANVKSLVIDLSDNRLSGMIPQFSAIDLIDLSHNELTGEIPVSLADLFSAWSTPPAIDLSYNNLSGDIPDAFIDRAFQGTVSEFLNLSNNHLTGSISPKIGKITNALDLSFNNLTGAIPIELGNYSNLRTLYVNNNALSGRIPKILEDRVLAGDIDVDWSSNAGLYKWIGWPSPYYSRIKPDPALGLDYNNIGYLYPEEQLIYSCVEILASGVQTSFQGFAQWKLALEYLLMDKWYFRLAYLRDFNRFDARNEDGDLPDCSGTFEVTNGSYSDIIEVAGETYYVSFLLIDDTDLMFELQAISVIQPL